MRQTVTMGLLTGRYATASPAEVLGRWGHPAPANRIHRDGRGDRRRGPDRAPGASGSPWGQAPRWETRSGTRRPRHARLGFEPGRTRSVTPPATEPPPNSGDAQDREHPVSRRLGQLPDRQERCSLLSRSRPAGRPGRRRPGLRPPARRPASRHQAPEPDPGCPGEHLDHRLRPGQVRGRGRPLAVARPRRDPALHGPRAVPRRLESASATSTHSGATLYEMLTLRPPFEGQDQLQLIRRIENEPPVPPRQLERRIPRDLETIVLKALAKDPNDRFATAEEMADELRRFVENRPIRSRPLPFYQRFWRWCKRNPGLAGANIAAAVLTTILAIVSTVAAWTYRDQRNQIAGQRDRDSAEAEDEDRDCSSSRRCTTGPAPGGSAAGRSAVRQPGGPEAGGRDRPRAEAAARAARPAPRRGDRLPGPARPQAHRPGHHPAPGRHRDRLRPHHDPLRPAVPRWDDLGPPRRRRPGDRPLPGPGRSRVSGSSASAPTAATWRPRIIPATALTVWDVDRRAVAVDDPGPVWRAARFSPDSRRIALVHRDGELLVYDLATGRPSRRWRDPRCRRPGLPSGRGPDRGHRQ